MNIFEIPVISTLDQGSRGVRRAWTTGPYRKSGPVRILVRGPDFWSEICRSGPWSGFSVRIFYESQNRILQRNLVLFEKDSTFCFTIGYFFVGIRSVGENRFVGWIQIIWAQIGETHSSHYSVKKLKKNFLVNLIFIWTVSNVWHWITLRMNFSNKHFEIFLSNLNTGFRCYLCYRA